MAEKKEQAAEEKPRQRGLERADGSLGSDEVQEKFDEAEGKGYFGEAPDPTPNQNYSVRGVTKGAPTPENDPALAAKARNATDAGRAGVLPEEKPALKK